PSLEHISPADKLAEPGALEALFAAAGVAAPVVTTEHWRMPLGRPGDFWPVIMGTSNRGVFDALPAAAQQRVKDSVLTRLRDEHVQGLEMDAIVAVARKGSVTEPSIARGDRPS
ncbi:MAG: hypothetical protein IT181_25990, partial [Acidobacteria bacterium]|nr:hypothetical protein [Acidobacteriota bacterium]